MSRLARSPNGASAPFPRLRPLGAAALALLAGACGTVDPARHQRLTAALDATAPDPALRAEEARLFEGALHLDKDALVRAALARNPSLDAARSSFRAALAEIPQATALDDPSFGYAIAPLSIASERVPFGQAARLAQGIPFPGKLDARGRVALFEAEAARAGYEAARLEVALLAELLFLDRWEVERALALNAHHETLLDDLKVSAEAALETGRGSLQGPLQVEIALAELARARVTLEARARVIEARLNGLLHRAPDAPLPPPPATLEDLSSSSEDVQALFRRAVERRPELLAALAETEAARAGVDLAEKQYLPDFSVEAQYNSMFHDLEHQLMVGGGITLPLQLGAKAAGVDEARARLSRREAERERLADEVRVEVQSALAELDEAERVVALYRERLLPMATARITAARAAFEAGRERLREVIDAENDLRTTELGLEMATASLHRARARLSRALGELPVLDGGAR